jgi:hypothetical protein
MCHQKDSAPNTRLEVYLLHWNSSYRVKHAPDESVRREKKVSPEGFCGRRRPEIYFVLLGVQDVKWWAVGGCGGSVHPWYHSNFGAF